MEITNFNPVFFEKVRYAWHGVRFKLTYWMLRLFSNTVFFTLNQVWPYRQKIILKNFSLAFPQTTNTDKNILLKKYYRHVADLLVEPFIMAQVEKRNVGQYIQYENLTLLQELLSNKKSIVLMASHYGNWEYLLTLPLFTSYRVIAAYSPISNTRIDSSMRKMRNKYGVVLIEKSEFYKHILRNEIDVPTIYLVISDQRPAKTSKQSLLFLNQKTMVPHGGAKIADKRDCAVVYLDVKKKSRFKYCYTFDLISDGGNLPCSDEIMSAYYEKLEVSIQEEPEFWLWSHDRWK
jgi:KDO2-lipid IV(A) lauroyltransferase